MTSFAAICSVNHTAELVVSGGAGAQVSERTQLRAFLPPQIFTLPRHEREDLACVSRFPHEQTSCALLVLLLVVDLFSSQVPLHNILNFFDAYLENEDTVPGHGWARF